MHHTASSQEEKILLAVSNNMQYCTNNAIAEADANNTVSPLRATGNNESPNIM